MISKEEYVLKRVKSLAKYNNANNSKIEPSLLKSLIEQWEFDYEIEKKYRPELKYERH